MLNTSPSPIDLSQFQIAIVGAGPAGLMAAEMLSANGFHPQVYEAMPTAGRKFLMAGKSGLNVTNAQPTEAIFKSLSPEYNLLLKSIDDFPNPSVRAWADDLGAETFVGSSGKIFPRAMKASPLLRVWLTRLKAQGTTLHLSHRWIGWDDEGHLCFETPLGRKQVQADATLFALGGGSWPKLGSTGSWVPLLQQQGLKIAPLQPANMGFNIAWSETFQAAWAGHPLKSAGFHVNGQHWRGEVMITAYGIEGGGLYPASAALRDTLAREREATLNVDLFPDLTVEQLRTKLSNTRLGQSLANTLRKALGLQGLRLSLLKECTDQATYQSIERLAPALKSLPLRLISPRPLAEAISTAGGVDWSNLDENYMATALPGNFFAGEMLNWEAPTGGYLLSICLGTGRSAAFGIMRWLRART